MNRADFVQKKFWAMPSAEVLSTLESSESGLSQEIAASRLEEFGPNEISKKDKPRRLSIFFGQFTSPLILILALAGAVTIGIKHYRDGIFIIVAILINAALGFYQENKAANALARLKTYIKDRVRVIRDDLEKEIDATEIVVGDVIKITAGVRIPADARLFLSNDISVDESILTGESLPVSKHTKPVEEEASVPDRKSMIYGGTLVVGGVGLAVVTATDDDTELGKIAALLKRKENDSTPLETYIKKLSMWAGIAFVVMAVLLFGLGALLNYSLLEMFLISVAVAVSAVPEGLPIALTVVLAIGVERLAKQKGVVKKLLAAEALGSTTLILTDKTGTLTEAKMEVAEISGEAHKEEILRLAMLVVEAAIENPDSDPEEWKIIGRPLEAAVVRAGAEHKLFVSDLIKNVEVLDKHPFNSADKYGAVCLKFNSKKTWIYLGAPDVLLKKSDTEKSEAEKLMQKIDSLAFSGYRVLGLLVDKNFTGILALNDPIRKGIKEVVREIDDFGIRTKIVTGDHKGTAIHVAKEIGLEVGDGAVLTGEELDTIGDKELKSLAQKIVVFARVTPEHKVRLTKIFQELGEVVAVTGDGVNDAPALERANVGVAVGSGTDIAKDSSDLVILDDDFKTIVAAIHEGRRIMSNIKKIVVYLFSNSLNELVLIGGSLIFGMSIPLSALQILWVNFFTDSFPSIALGFEKEKDTSSVKRNKKSNPFNSDLALLITVIGVISSAILFSVYYFLNTRGVEEEIAHTFVFANFSLYTVFLVFSIKSINKGIFKYNPFNNPYLLVGAAIATTLTLIAIYIPYFQELFGTVSLPLSWMVGVVVVGVVNLLGVEFGKFLFRWRLAK